MRVVPLVGREAREHEQHEADDEVGEHDVEPDLDGERREEGEEARVRLRRPLEEDADAEVHERLREVDHLLAHVADRERRDRQVRLLQRDAIRDQIPDQNPNS